MSSLNGGGVTTPDPKFPIFVSIDAGTYLPRLPDEFFDDLCQTSDYSIAELTNSAAENFEKYRRDICKELEKLVSQKQTELVARMKQIHEDIGSEIQSIRARHASERTSEGEGSFANDDAIFMKRSMNDSSFSVKPSGALGASLARTNGQHFPASSSVSTKTTRLKAVDSPEKAAPIKSEKQNKVSHKVKFATEEDFDMELEENGTHDGVFNIDEDLETVSSSVQPFATDKWLEDDNEDRIVKDESVGLLHSGLAASFSAIPNSYRNQGEMPSNNHFGDSELQGPYDTKELDAHSRPMASRRNNYSKATEHAEEDLALVGAAMANAPSHRHLLTRSAAIRVAEGHKSSQHAQDLVEFSKLAQSVPSVGAIQIQKCDQNSSVKEGLDREPKTSLPYNERLIVPSLLKATRGRKAYRDPTASAGSLSQNMPGTSSVRKTGFRISSSTHDSPSRAISNSNTLQNISMVDLPPVPDVPSQHIRLEPSNTIFPHDVPGTQHMIQQEDNKIVSKLLYFTHYLQNLKLSKRTGWYHHNVPFPESIADHMYRMAVLSILIESDEIDFRKCSIMALVHDMAEALVGDLTPLCKVEKDEKRRREVQAIHFLTRDLLGDTQASHRIYDLWHEYEERSTPEAKLVKDLDCFELCLQAYEYERTHNITDLQPFWDGAAPKVSHPEVQRWMGALLSKREAMWTSRGVSYRTQA